MVRRQTIRESRKDLYHQQVYAVIWAAHQAGEPWLYAQEICDRLLSQHGIDLRMLDASYTLAWLADIGYLASSAQSRQPIWKLSKHAIAANASKVGEPIAPSFKGCTSIRIPPAMANDDRFKLMPLDELRKYAC